MARRCWCLAAALLCLYAGAAAAESARAGCTSDIAGYSQFLGLKKAGAKFVDYAPLAKNGHIKQISLYFNKASGCVRGAKAAFGPLPTPGMIGSSANTTEVALKLKDGEHVTKAEFKAKQCIGYLKLSTNTGRSISVGSASAPGSMAQSAANKTGGHLVALRGFQSTADGKPGPLQQLQFVWGTSQCPSTVELLMMETGSLTVDQPGRAAVNAVNDDPSVCAPKPEMCNEKASMNSFSYCVWNAPFGRPSCKGGCCFSSGKCASSSCAISGVGRDVANMICYGTNAGFGFGGSNLCAGLACKLAVPGCTTDAFGGNCVGTVVAFGDKSTLNQASQKYIGAPCLDATPSDTTLDEQGNPAGISGVYMGKLWTICDCAGNPGMLETPAHMLVNFTATSIGNLTKNDVLLAISQVLPKVNLSEALNATRTTELFPSFTDMFKMPEMPSIQLPSFLTHGSNLSGESIQIKLPDLGQLLGSLAAKANNATAEVNKAVDGAAAPDSSSSSSSSSDTPSNSSAAPKIKLPDFGKLLSSFTSKAADASRSSSSAAEPAVSTPVSAASVSEPNPSTPPSSSSSDGSSIDSSSSSSDASKTQAEALENWKEFLGNLKTIIPNLNKANITASSSTSSSDAPASSDAPVAAAYSDPAAAPVPDAAAAAAAAAPTDKPESGTLMPEVTAAAPTAEVVPAAAQPAEQAPVPAAAAPVEQQTPEPAAAAAAAPAPAPAQPLPAEPAASAPAEAAAPAAEATAPSAAEQSAAAEPLPAEPVAAAALPEPVPMPAPAPRRFTGFSRTFSAVDQIVSTPGMLPPYDPAAEAAAQAAAAAAAELAAAEAAAAAAPAAAAAEQAAAAAPTAA